MVDFQYDFQRSRTRPLYTDGVCVMFDNRQLLPFEKQHWRIGQLFSKYKKNYFHNNYFRMYFKFIEIIVGPVLREKLVHRQKCDV